jgi:hypothetical protein
MVKAIKVEVKPDEIIEAVKKMKKIERDAFLEDLLASTSPEYLKSIKEARADYKAGRIKSHKEVFGRGVKSALDSCAIPLLIVSHVF